MNRGTMIVAGAAALAGVAALVYGGTANAAGVPGDDGGALLMGVGEVSPPPGYAPPADVLQTRPIPPSTALTGQYRLDLISIAQRQLNQLGYGPLVVSGIDDAATRAATVAFNSAEAPRVAAYSGTGLDIAHATLAAIDDKYRENTGQGRASDYVAAASGSLLGMVRRRQRGA